MPRVARIVLSGFTHHVTQRGNNRQDVFFLDEDRLVYLEVLGEYLGTVTGFIMDITHPLIKHGDLSGSAT